MASAALDLANQDWSPGLPAVIDWLQVFRALDKKGRLGWRGVFDLMTYGRRDTSGDWMPGAGLPYGYAAQMIAKLIGLSEHNTQSDWDAYASCIAITAHFMPLYAAAVAEFQGDDGLDA